MLRLFFCSAALVTALLATGCCGPIGYGVGGGVMAGGCNDCDGTYDPGIMMTPMDGFRNLRRSIVCGGGCGEVYTGEWISTPPDAQDPCCGDEFVGGAYPCSPFNWRPGTLLNGFYGQRFVGGDCYDDCCGDVSCDGGCGGEFIDEGYIEGNSGGCSGCASCRANSSPSRMANRTVTTRSGSRSANPRTRTASRVRTSGYPNQVRR